MIVNIFPYRTRGDLDTLVDSSIAKVFHLAHCRGQRQLRTRGQEA